MQPPNHLTNEAFREAARDFMNGFWGNPQRRARLLAAMSTSWAEYKRETHYEILRQRLSDAAKAYRSE